RFARAIDRTRDLAAKLPAQPDPADQEAALRMLQLAYAERRVLLLLRALTAFYLSLGAFAAASFASLLGAICHLAGWEGPRLVTFAVGLASGVLGVGGLLTGSGVLVWETRQALAILREEVRFLRGRRSQASAPALPGSSPPL